MAYKLTEVFIRSIVICKKKTHRVEIFHQDLHGSGLARASKRVVTFACEIIQKHTWSLIKSNREAIGTCHSFGKFTLVFK